MKILKKLQSKKNSNVLFDQVIFGLQQGPYLWRRFKWLVLTSTVLWAISLARLYFLKDYHQFSDLISLIVVEQIGFLVFTGWWGFLDIIRSRLSSTQSENRFKIIHSWYAKSICLSLLIFLLVSAALVVTGTLELPRKNVQALTIWFLVFKMSCEIPLIFLHSCSFSFRRVFFPSSLIIATELVGLFTIILMGPLIGPWAMFWGYVFTGLTQLIVQRIMYLKSYKLLRLPLNALKFSRHALFYPETQLSSVSGAFLSASVACVARAPVSILYSIVLLQKIMALQYVLLIAVQVIHFASVWPRVLYFDFRKYAGSPWKHLLKYAQLRILKFVVVIGLITGLVAYLTCAIILQNSSLFLIPLCLGVSLLAYYSVIFLSKIQGKIALQMHDYCEYGSIHSQSLFEKILLSRRVPLSVFKIHVSNQQKSMNRPRNLLLKALNGHGLVLNVGIGQMIWCDWSISNEQRDEGYWIKSLQGYICELKTLGRFNSGQEAVEKITQFIPNIEIARPPQDIMSIANFLTHFDPKIAQGYNLRKMILHGQRIYLSESLFEATIKSGEVIGFRKI